MLIRLFTAGIVIFWITMTGLLVRSELWPDHSALRSVPVELVTKQMWHHQQKSDLTIWSDGARTGHLSLEPRVRPEDGARLLIYSGNLQLRLPGAGKQRLSWDGVAEFDRTSQLRSFLLGVGLRQAPAMRAELLFLPNSQTAEYRLLQNGEVIDTETYALDETGVKKVLAQLEIPPAFLETFRSRETAAPRITAQQSSMLIHKERIDTYLLSVVQSGQTMLEAHVSQLGSILEVRTAFGYSLSPEDIIP